MLLVIVIFTLLFLGIEFSSLVKNKHWKELYLGALLMVLAIIYGLDFNYGWHVLPNPILVFKKLQPLTNAFINFFHLNT